jgi:beta-mannosidase
MPIQLLTLHHGWTVRPIAGPVPDAVAEAAPVPASVPGTVHTDLLAAGLIPDPYLDDNERLLGWIGLTDWRYETAFPWTPGHDRAQLVFEGLDTVAAAVLNGAVVARTANMRRTYRLDVHDLLQEGTNQLSVTFGSVVRHADRMSLELGARPHANHHPYNEIRKMACNFGWDWGPDLVTAGMWRPVTLQSWRAAGSPPYGRSSTSSAAAAGSMCTWRSSGPTRRPPWWSGRGSPVRRPRSCSGRARPRGSCR